VLVFFNTTVYPGPFSEKIRAIFQPVPATIAVADANSQLPGHASAAAVE
jgi:hypothetical protein